MLWIFLSLWTVIVRDDSGNVVLRERLEDSRQVLAIVKKHIEKGYFVTVMEGGSDSDLGPVLNSFVEGATNVVTSVNAGQGIQVNNLDPSNPVISLPSCSTGQILQKTNSGWQCADPATLGGGGGDYTRITMISSKKTGTIFDAYYICDTLTANGYTDWRLPTIAELSYICVKNNICKDGDLYMSSNVGTNRSNPGPLSVFFYNGSYRYTVAEEETAYSFYCVR